MKRYFACSDIHGFYDELIDALTYAGFDSKDPEHILIVCGDIFDRGGKPKEVYSFLKSLPKERRILIRGNHETCLKEMCERGFAMRHDMHNRTYHTALALANVKEDFAFDWCAAHEGEFNDAFMKSGDDSSAFDAFIRKRDAFIERTNERIFNGKLITKILDWIDSDEWVDYAEIGKYVFVHAFIPTREKHVEDDFRPVKDDYDPDWRNASRERWDAAKWGCPWKLYIDGLFEKEEKKGKILVCGHWHTSEFWNRLDYAHDLKRWLVVDEDNPIYKSDKYPGLIGLDACTALTHKVNVLVLNEEEM